MFIYLNECTHLFVPSLFWYEILDMPPPYGVSLGSPFFNIQINFNFYFWIERSFGLDGLLTILDKWVSSQNQLQLTRREIVYIFYKNYEVPLDFSTVRFSIEEGRNGMRDYLENRVNEKVWYKLKE